MKPDIHPKTYRKVVFKDMSCDYSFLTQSCVDTKETIKWEDGNEYPLYKLEISSKSHPFYTGKQNLIDTAGRIDKFNKRFDKTKAMGKNATPVAAEKPTAVVEEVKVETAPVPTEEVAVETAPAIENADATSEEA